MMIAHKIALDPNHKQGSYFARASGTARFAYNGALGEWKRQYRRGGKPAEVALRRQLNALKREPYRWMFEVSQCAAQAAIIDLGVGFRACFEKRGAYPRCKKKGVHDSFCAANEVGTFRGDGRRIKLPVVGWLRMREAVRFSGTVKRVTVSREADRWFASLMVETADIQPVVQPQEVVGVDLGINKLAVLSDGAAISGPKAHTALRQRLRRTSRAFSRKQRGSRNAAKAKRRLARLHARIAHIRKDATHKATTHLVKTYRRIGIEDLNVRGMAGNRHLARSIMDGGLQEFRRQLEYKARFYGAIIVVAISGFLQARPVLAAVRSRLNWLCGNGGSVALNAALKVTAMGTRRETLNVWPQALRCQPVERNALARLVRAA